MHADRREFMTWSAGGAFMLGLAGQAQAQETPAAAPSRPQSPWFKVNSNGRVTVYSNAVEMGQGSHTGHATIIADELDVPWDMVDVEMADINTYANQIFTGGSGSISRGRPLSVFETARRAGATARAQFVQAAAQQWSTDAGQCETAGGKVVNKATKASLTYAQLAEAASKVPAPQQVALKDAAARVCIGKPMSTKRVDKRVNGTETYGIDVRVPGMVRAAVIQAPVFGAKLASVDEAPAKAIPGVTQVVKLEDAVAVIAGDTWTAIKASRALKPEWTMPELRSSTPTYRKALEDAHKTAIATEAAAGTPAKALRDTFTAASKKVEASYDLSRVAHVTMEPQNAVAHVTADKIEIWAPTQIPSQVYGGAARWAGKPGAKVVFHPTMLGGGFGRRLNADYIEQAVKIATQVNAPVQLVWTREEDFGHDTYRTAVRQTYRAGLRDDGLIDGYETISGATDTQIRGGMNAPYYPLIKTHVVTQAPAVRTGVPLGPWRSVDEGISTWGKESFIDECAHAAGMDPLAYRLKLAEGDARTTRLLNAVADAIGWKSAKPNGVGRGIAVGTGFGSYAAHAVEVEVKGNELKVNKIVVAGDIGTIVAPEQVRAQFEGGTLMALGTALSEAITITDGKADQANFGPYAMLRMNQAPPVQVILFESPEAAIGGAGEPPVPTLAPALANAIFAASGKRVRSLPINKQGFTV